MEIRYETLQRMIAEHASNECLIWPYQIGKRWGYGYVYIPGIGNRRVHREAYKIANGSYPIDDCCHTCDQRGCINPRHLFDGKDVDNFADMIRKGRSSPGEKNHEAKLTEEQVVKARTLYALGATKKVLAEKFGVSFGGMKKVLNGQSWPHIAHGLTPEQQRKGLLRSKARRLGLC